MSFHTGGKSDQMKPEGEGCLKSEKKNEPLFGPRGASISLRGSFLEDIAVKIRQ